MNKLRFAPLPLVLVLLMALHPSQAKAELPPKAKAFVMVTAYGAGGGALLGLASMAFGTSSRAIAMGASLGLYAGILFGTYVLVTHAQAQSGGYNQSSPYQDGADDYGDYGEDTEAPADSFNRKPQGPELFARVDSTMDASTAAYRRFETKKGGNIPPLKVNLFTFNF